jgi:hypothetical protein
MREEKEGVMSINQEVSKNFGNLCCSLWMRQRNPARKKIIGILLIVIGMIWLGAKAGLLDFSWLQTVYFWPAVLILLGVLMVYKGSLRGITRTMDNKTKEE